MKISVFGCGYVGLTAACCFAKMGHHVLAVEKDSARLDILKRGKIPFFEPGLEDLLKAMKKQGRLTFSYNTEKAIQNSEVIICAVGTPSKKNGEVDMEGVLSVAKLFGQFGGGSPGRPWPHVRKLFINKSTLPIGMHQQVDEVIRKSQPKKFTYSFAYNPEFLSEGTAIENFLKPYRIVVGAVRGGMKAKSMVQTLYRPLLRKKIPFLFTDATSAEMIKYTSNAFLATKISFINEVAHFCERVGVDISKVSKGIGLDPRIGSQFLRAGIGFGGSCLPKDVEVLIRIGRKNGIDFKVLKAVEQVNKNQPLKFIEKVRQKLGPLKGKKIAIWGLSFKPNTDDIRCSPSLVIIDALLKEKAQLTVYDPLAMEHVKKIYGGHLLYARDMREAVRGVDVLLILTGWDEFRKTERQKIKALPSHIFRTGKDV